MSIPILVIGPSGGGKSTSLMNLPPKETFIINCDDKPLPFKGAGKLYVEVVKDNKYQFNESNSFTTTSTDRVIGCLRNISDKRPEIKTAVIDTINAVMEGQFIGKMAEKGYEKWNQLAYDIVSIINTSKALRDDLIVYILAHEVSFIDENGAQNVRMKTMGKILEDKITPESKFTVVLRARVDKSDPIPYGFDVNSRGNDIVKSPMGMFESERIPNDLNIVNNAIRAYYQIPTGNGERSTATK